MKQSRKEYKENLRKNASLTEDGMTYDEISAILGISKAEVRKIEDQALKKLKLPTEKNKELKKYFFGQ
jgi:DNA-directed RNA polymerase sigma subunit (sigma70/sigma32)